MNRHTRLTTRITLLVVLLTFAPWASAQAPANIKEAQLQAENQALRERIATLESALDEVRSKLRELTRLVSTVPRSPVTASTPAALSPASGTIPDDPTSCPDSLMMRLRQTYKQYPPSRSKKPATAAKIEQWCKVQNQLSFDRITWLVRAEREQPTSQGDTSVWVRVFDELTGRQLGAAAAITLPARHVRTLRADPEKAWLLEADLSSAVFYDADRPTPGVFEYPPMVGPHVVFGLALERPVLAAAPAGVRTILAEDDTSAPPASDPGR